MIFQTGLIPLIIIYRDISETDWFAICGSLSKFIFRIVRIGLSQMVVNRMGVPQEVELGSLLFPVIYCSRLFLICYFLPSEGKLKELYKMGFYFSCYLLPLED